MEIQPAMWCLIFLSLCALCIGATTNTTCGGRLSTDNGTIVSPGYPDDYPQEMDCEWIISVTEGYVIRIEFEYMQMELHVTCVNDWVEIRNGISRNDDVLLRACYYAKTPGPILTTGHHAYVRSMSDSTFQYGGFKMNYFSFNETEAAAKTTAASNLEPGQKAYPVRVTFELVVTDITFHPSHFSYRSLEDDVRTTLLEFLQFQNSKVIDVRIHEMSKSGLIVDAATTTTTTTTTTTQHSNSTNATNTTPTTTTTTNTNNVITTTTPQPDTNTNDVADKSSLITEVSAILDTTSSSDPYAVTGKIINALIELSQAAVKVSGQPTPVRVTFGDALLSKNTDKCAVLQSVDPCQDGRKCVVVDDVARCSYDDQDEADLALVIGLGVGIPLLIIIVVLILVALFLKQKNGQMAG